MCFDCWRRFPWIFQELVSLWAIFEKSTAISILLILFVILTERKDMHVSGGLHGMLHLELDVRSPWVTGKAGNDRFVRGASLAVRCLAQSRCCWCQRIRPFWPVEQWFADSPVFFVNQQSFYMGSQFFKPQVFNLQMHLDMYCILASAIHTLVTKLNMVCTRCFDMFRLLPWYCNLFVW